MHVLLFLGHKAHEEGRNMGHNIKVGDKVRLTGEGWDEYYGGVTVGSIVEVTRITDGFIFAGDADDVGNSEGLYSEGNPHHWEEDLSFSVELVEPKTRFEVGDEVYDASSAKYGLGHIIGVRDGYYRVRFYYAEKNGQYSSRGDAHAREEDEVTQDCVEQDCICRDVGEPNSLVGRYAPVEEGSAPANPVVTMPKDQIEKLSELISKYTETTQPEFVAEPPALNAVDPDHYKFPNGAEVIQISQWLTANSAQAMQYITRSSRIDGKNKGDTLEDLEKAKVFIDFEIARLKGDK